MNVKELLKSRELINQLEESNTNLQTEINLKLEEIEDLRRYLPPIECEIELNENRIKKLREEIQKELCNVKEPGVCEDDIQWLSLGCMENQGYFKYLEFINYNQHLQRLESGNGKMLFIVENVVNSDIETMPEYPIIENMIKNFKFTEDDIFNHSCIGELPEYENPSDKYCIYTTKSGLVIEFTKEYLYSCLAIGDEIIISYSGNEDPVMFKCGNRRAYLMPVRPADNS